MERDASPIAYTPPATDEMIMLLLSGELKEGNNVDGIRVEVD